MRRTYHSCLVAGSVVLLTSGCGSKGTQEPVTRNGLETVQVEGPWKNGQRIPRRYTCDGANVAPEFGAAEPGGARDFAIVMTDPDAPGGVFTHWVAWGLDPGAEGLGEAESPPREGRNDFGTTGYRGPCPPPGHGRHRYVFRLYALDSEPELTAGAAKTELERAIEGHVLTTAELVGTHER